MTEQLWNIGVTDVFADGSFVEEKDHPNDIDGHELEFPSAFRQSRRDGMPRGIIKLRPGAAR